MECGDFTQAQIARRVACAESHVPVCTVPGNAEPVLTGEGWYFTTPGGTYIRHPNAYRWPKVYHASTRRVEVGEDWMPQFRADETHGVDLAILCGSRYESHGHRADMGYSRAGERLWLVRAPDGWKVHVRAHNGRGAIKRALRNRKQQREADAQAFGYLARVWVGREDSLAAGNCAAGTDAFVERLRARFGDIGGIRADALLDFERSVFTERTIRKASQRYA